MSGLRHRALEYFVAPEPSTEARVEAHGATRAALGPPAAGVLGATSDVSAVASLLASQLRVRCRAGCVVIAEWSSGEPLAKRTGVASRQARQLAARLAGRGLDVGTQGRIVTTRLPADPLAAGSAWRRVLAAADCPSVCVMAGPRPEGLDAMLAELDLIVLVPGEVATAELGQLALAELAGVRALVVSSRPVQSGMARLLASSSIAASRVLGDDVTRAVRALA